jgi:hypothetical protein
VSSVDASQEREGHHHSVYYLPPACLIMNWMLAGDFPVLASAPQPLTLRPRTLLLHVNSRSAAGMLGAREKDIIIIYFSLPCLIARRWMFLARDFTAGAPHP